MLRGPVTGFDHQTVQPLPELHLESTDQQLIPGVPLYGGLQTSWSRWWRQGPSADFLPGKTDPEGVFVPGRDPLRRGHRLVLSPELYYTANLGDVFELVPSLRWSSMFYDFDGPYGASTRRHFVRGRIELSTTVEKVYGGLIKHKMRPLVSYSNIPWVEEDKEHPFVQQLNYISASTSRLVSQNQGRQFDDHDIIPLYSDRVPQYFYPEGNSISYSLSNRFVLKSSDEVEEWQKPERKLFVNDRDPRPLPSLVAADQYRRVLDLWTGQTFDFTELRKDPRDQRPFSRLFHLMSLTTKRVQANSETYYYPYSQAFQFSIGGTFYIAKYAQRLLRFERSLRLSYSRNLVTSYNDALTLGVTWSLNDYLLLSAERSVDFLTARVLRTAGQIIYQSPSQCFQFILSLERSIDRGFSIRPSIAMNLGGGSFMGVSDSNAASSVAPTGATTLQ